MAPDGRISLSEIKLLPVYSQEVCHAYEVKRSDLMSPTVDLWEL